MPGTTVHQEKHLGKPNFGFEKRQRELEKKRKKEEKLQRKLEKKNPPSDEQSATPDDNDI